MNIGYHSDFMDRIIERANKRNERTEKMINKMLDKSEPILNAGKPKPQTNEEWLRSATTEELAGKIYAWHTKGYARGKNGLPLNPITEVVEWLKQPKE